MTNNAFLIPDTVVSLAAFLGLVIVIRHIGRLATKDPLAARTRMTLMVVAAFLGMRILHWNTDIGIFRFGTYAAAAAIPVAVLLLTEGLLRRHAPRWAKLAICLGALALTVVALWPQLTVRQSFGAALMGFQLASLLIICWLVLTRDRSSLTPAENRTIGRISLALLPIFPFLMTDYRFDAYSMPVRMSGLAILVTCWFYLNLDRPLLRRRIQILFIAIYAVAGLVAGILIARQAGLATDGAIQITAMITALMFLAAIAHDDISLRQDATRDALMGEISGGNFPSLDYYLDELKRRGVLDDTIILSDADLRDFDAAALATAFDADPAMVREDLPADRDDDTLAQSQLRTLFDRYTATHLFEVSRQPLVVAVANPPSFSASTADRDLSTAFGLARLISERDALKRKTDEEKPA